MEEKRIQAQRAKPRTQTPAVDALIGEKEQTGQKERTKKNREQVTEEMLKGGSVMMVNWVWKLCSMAYESRLEE